METTREANTTGTCDTCGQFGRLTATLIGNICDPCQQPAPANHHDDGGQAVITHMPFDL